MRVLARRTKRPFAPLFLLLLLALACAAPLRHVAEAPVQLPPPITPQASPTPPPPASPTASATPTPPPTATPTPTPSPSPTPCAEPGVISQTTFPSAIAGPQRNVRIYQPPCYGRDGRNYPTLYILHGNARREEEWDVLGLDDAAEEGFRDGSLPPMLIVMPDGSGIGDRTSGGPWSYEAVVVDELIPFVEAHYCAWRAPAGRAIGGLSRGGYWALEIAFRHPKLFASVGGHSAALLDPAGPGINPQFTGPNNDLGDLRVYLDIGDRDWLRTNTVRLHDDLTAAGVSHTWLLHEGGEHNDLYWRTHLTEYLAWYAAAWPSQRARYPLCRLESD